MTSVELLLLVTVSLILAVCQFARIGRSFRGGYGRLLPQFRFFGPRPLAWDVVLAYRPLRTEPPAEWLVFGASAAKWHHSIWGPERRIGKALIDQYRRLASAASVYNEPGGTSFVGPLINLALKDPAIRGAREIQIALILVRGAYDPGVLEHQRIQEVLRVVTDAHGHVLGR